MLKYQSPFGGRFKTTGIDKKVGVVHEQKLYWMAPLSKSSFYRLVFFFFFFLFISMYACLLLNSADDYACFQMEAKNLQTGEDCFTTVTINGARSTCSTTPQQFQQRLLFHGEKGELLVSDGNLTHRPKDGAEVVLCQDSSSQSESINNNNDCPRLPPIHEKGVSRLFCDLAEKMRTQKNADFSGLQFASFDDALYVQAVIEAVRSSSKNKAWTKVTVVQDTTEDCILSS